MKFKSIYFLFLSIVLFSCKDNSIELKIEQEKEAKKAEVIFNSINNAWSFKPKTLDANTQNTVNNWNEWNNFLKEINQKPKGRISEFQKKAKILSKKAEELNNNIPKKYNLPQIKSRLLVLTTKLKELELFINLSHINEKKIILLIPEINQEIQSLQLQMQEIVKREQIPSEIGEPDRIKMLDTTRLAPSTLIKNQVNLE